MTIDFNTNKSICPYPWIHSYVGSHYEKRLCCVSDDIDEFKKVPTKDFWNSDYMKNIRLRMLAGEKNNICHTCYEFEENNVKSLRQMSKEAYRHNNFDEMLKVNPDGSVDTNPVYFDYRTIYCNLQCVSCGYVYSSRHIELHNKMYYGGAPNIKLNVDMDFELGMLDEIVTSLRNKTCQNIYWAGGEPMLSHIHWGVISEMLKLREDKNYRNYIDYELFMHYNSNLTILNWKNKNIPELLKFNQPSIQASIDGTNETFEYTRDGAKWNNVKNNWIEYYTHLNKNKQMGIASVLHLPVLLDIDRWFDFFEKYEIKLYNHRYFSSIDYPSSFLDVRLLPQHIFDRIIGHAIERFEKCDMELAENSVSVLKSYIDDRERNKDHFNNIQTLIDCKEKTKLRDKYLITKRPFVDLIKITDRETYEWYQTIPVKGVKHA